MTVLELLNLPPPDVRQSRLQDRRVVTESAKGDVALTAQEIPHHAGGVAVVDDESAFATATLGRVAADHAYAALPNGHRLVVLDSYAVQGTQTVVEARPSGRSNWRDALLPGSIPVIPFRGQSATALYRARAASLVAAVGDMRHLRTAIKTGHNRSCLSPSLTVPSYPPDQGALGSACLKGARSLPDRRKGAPAFGAGGGSGRRASLPTPTKHSALVTANQGSRLMHGQRRQQVSAFHATSFHSPILPLDGPLKGVTK